MTPTQPDLDQIQDFAKQTNTHATDYIKFADAKVAGLVTLTAAAAAISKVLIPEHAGGWFVDFLGWVKLAASIGVLLGLFGTFWCAIIALGSRTPKADKSLGAFPDVAALQLADYINEVFALNQREIINNVLRHNYVLSKIAMAKHGWVRRSQRSCYLWGFCILLLGFLRVTQV